MRLSIEQPFEPYGVYGWNRVEWNRMEFRLVTADCYYILFFRVYLTQFVDICLFVCLFDSFIIFFLEWLCVSVFVVDKINKHFIRNTNRKQRGKRWRIISVYSWQHAGAYLTILLFVLHRNGSIACGGSDDGDDNDEHNQQSERFVESDFIKNLTTQSMIDVLRKRNTTNN